MSTSVEDSASVEASGNISWFSARAASSPPILRSSSCTPGTGEMYCTYAAMRAALAGSYT